MVQKEENGTVIRVGMLGKSDFDPGLRFLKRLFGITLLTFRKNDGSISKPRLLIAIILVLTIINHSGHIVFFAFKQDTNNLPNTLIATFWAVQCLISIFLTIYWQFGYFQILFNPNTWAQLNNKLENRREIRMWPIYSMFVFLLTGILASTLWLLYKYHYVQGVMKLNMQLYESFGNYTGGLGIILSFYSEFVWIIVFMFYHRVTSLILRKLEYFNEELKQIGSGKAKKEDIIKELVIFYDRQIDLTTRIRQINSTFEVFTFFMVGSVIISLIFSIINFMQVIRRESGTIGASIIYFVHVAVSSSELAFLTRTPARIHASVGAVEGILFSNKKIWIPYNEEIYQIANTLISHSKQDGLGISLWGYALMTKSLILTTVSVTLTYLTLIIQMGQGVPNSHPNSAIS